MRRRSFALPFVLLALSCAPARRATPWQEVRELTPAFLAGAHAADPSLALDERGRVALSWVTRDPRGADAWLSVSADSGEHWSQPVRLNTASQRVASYPESRPVLAWGRDGLLAAAWASARSDGDAADIAVRVSADGGREWGAVHLVNGDRNDPSSGYHGFMALDVLPDGRPLVAWVDGRASAGLEPEPARAEIYAVASADGGATWGRETWVAGDVCPCCRIALHSARRESGTIDVAVAYRGAAHDLRDPRLAISTDAGATFAFDTLVSADRWKLRGCPSVGPALTLEDAGRGHYAWFTGDTPEDAMLPDRPAPGVYLVTWRVGVGAVGVKRALGDSLERLTLPMLARLDRGTLVGVLGRAVGLPGRQVLALRTLELDGRLTPWVYLGSGVQSAAIAGQGARGAWAAWAEATAGGSRVRVVRLAGR
jgi:hypothetical protein